LGKLQAFAYEKMKCPLMSTPLDAQGKVFTLLTQASGTEIGLTIRKCLMDGQINFVSQPHAGSTFTFTTFFERCDRSAISESKGLFGTAYAGFDFIYFA